MLKNIVFDMGNVLTEFAPGYFVTCVGVDDDADRECLLNGIFHTPEWGMQDAGVVCEAELEKIVRGRIPERLYDAAHKLIFGWDEFSRPTAGMEALIRDCRAAGLKMYLLSNASVRQPEYWPAIPGSEYFDGTVISGIEKCLKPSEEIYRILLDRYGLKAEECLFVDDMPVNVEGAVAVGLMGFRFTGDTDLLRAEIRKLGAAV